MSLRAWYVLNGNVKNQGLGDFELTQVTAPTWATGKLCNQALNAGAFRWTAEQTAKILNNNELSYSAWIYVGDADTRSMIFGNNNNSTNRYFSLFQYPNKNALHWSWNTVDGGGIWAGYVENVLPTGKWTHIAFAYKSGSAKIYVNGELVGSGTPKVNISSYSLAYNVIINNANHRMQDIRIYDHCLSLKEVKELSKGLCLHYKLDDQYYSIVAECAGLNNKHLTNYKSCTLVPSPVYIQAYNFNHTGYCYNNSVPLSLQQFTISLWVKPTTNTSQHFLFGTFDKTDSSWTNTGIGVFRNNGNNYYQIYFKSDAEGSAKNMGGSSIVCTLNEWTHMVIWWDGTTSKVYLNGVLKNTQTYGSNGNCIFKNIYLGNSMFNSHPDGETENAAMSDFRVYATALTEDDILELYQTRASVDNDKNLFGYYLKEV